MSDEFLTGLGLDLADAEPVRPSELAVGDWLVRDDAPHQFYRLESEQHSLVYVRDGKQPYAAISCLSTKPGLTLSQWAQYRRIPAAKWRGFSNFGAQLPMLVQASHPAVTLGADPEVFVERDGEVVPAWTFLPANSTQATHYWDGVQAEFRVLGQPTCQDYFSGYLCQALRGLHSQLPKGAKLTLKSVVECPASLLSHASEAHLAFGCKPSLNAYGHIGQVVENPRRLPWRFAGGHIHFGLSTDLHGDPRIVDGIKMMDAVLGVASVVFEPGENPIRRQFYGLAGEYRLPAHGVEYRTLSNFWLRCPQVYYWTFSTGRKAFQLGFQGFRRYFQASDAEVCAAINQQNHELAREIMQRNRAIYLAIWDWCFPDPASGKHNKGKATWEKVFAGASNLFSDDIAANWELAGTRAWGSSPYPGRWGNYV